MRYPHPLVQGVILGRRKRFLADVEVGGERTVAHLANTGAMAGCWTPGGRCWLTRSDDPRRSLAWSVEQTDAGHRVLVNTARPNRIVEEAVRTGLPELGPVERIAREPVLPGGGRADLLLDGSTWVEVKNATWVDGDTVWFPDAPSVRAAHHVAALAERARAGDGAVLLLHVGAEAGSVVRPARHVDPAFGAALDAAVDAGLRVVARRVRLTDEDAVLGDPVPFVRC